MYYNVSLRTLPHTLLVTIQAVISFDTSLHPLECEYALAELKLTAIA